MVAPQIIQISRHLLIFFPFVMQIPEAFTGSLVQEGKPQYLTVISIRVTRLTQQDDFELGKRFFTGNICNNFGLLTNVPLPAVSIEISKEKLEASATRCEISITKEKSQWQRRVGKKVQFLSAYTKGTRRDFPTNTNFLENILLQFHVFGSKLKLTNHFILFSHLFPRVHATVDGDVDWSVQDCLSLMYGPK